ncbi:universal stress protein [Deinococcus saxicola]|uniref:universal stress protein n=1 Tax=Deinococcus saxicola TaxID=249406 RepID=UPI0039EFEFB9
MTTIPMNRILVTTDGSELGQHALIHAQGLAQALGAELIVLSIQTDPLVAAYGEYAYAMPTPNETMDEMKACLEHILHERVPDARIMVERAQGRHVSCAILDVAREEGAQMIVMTTHGRSGLGRALMGSVAQAVAQHSPVPVLLIKGDQGPVDWGKSAAPS